MALVSAGGALRWRHSEHIAESVPPSVRRSLLLAGLAAAGCAGALAPQVGPLTLVAGLAGGMALLAALVSSHAALAILIALLLVPIGAAGELPLNINEIDAVYGAALLGLAIRTVLSGRPITAGPLGLALATFVLAGAVALAAGVLGSGETAKAMSHFRGLFGYALIPLLVVSLGNQAAFRRRTLVYLLCLVGVLTAARGVLSWAELNGLLHLNGALHRLAAPDNEELIGAVPALSGDFGYLRAWAGNFEGNTLGAFMLLLLPATCYLALRADHPLARVGFAGGALLVLVALLVSYSRGAYFGLAVIAVPVFLALWRRQPLAALALAAGTTLLLAYLVSHVPGAEDRLTSLRSLQDDPTVQHRRLVYEQIADSLARSPVWGIGLGTSVGVVGAGADSLYLFLLLRGGLLVGAASLALVWLAGRPLLASWKEGRLGALEGALAAGLLGFAAHSVVDYALWNPKLALAVWLVAGLLMAAALEPDDSPAGDREERQWPRS